jgi:hypothetical protein
MWSIHTFGKDSDIALVTKANISCKKHQMTIISSQFALQTSIKRYRIVEETVEIAESINCWWTKRQRCTKCPILSLEKAGHNAHEQAITTSNKRESAFAKSVGTGNSDLASKGI